MVDDELVTDGRTPETLTNDGLLVMVYSNLVLFRYDFFFLVSNTAIDGRSNGHIKGPTDDYDTTRR